MSLFIGSATRQALQTRYLLVGIKGTIKKLGACSRKRLSAPQTFAQTTKFGKLSYQGGNSPLSTCWPNAACLKSADCNTLAEGLHMRIQFRWWDGQGDPLDPKVGAPATDNLAV